MEHEDFIGTLIETNERAMAAIQMYDDLKTQELKPATGTLGTSDSPSPTIESSVYGSQERYGQGHSHPKRNVAVHPDLEDLSFGSLGSSTNLPPPLRPSTRSEDDRGHQGSLSDFSDYESSGEEAHAASSRKRGEKDYFHVSDDPDDDYPARHKSPHTSTEVDPFADPFADEAAVGSTKAW